MYIKLAFPRLFCVGWLQILTYLGAVTSGSILFLVFINASSSFVVTNVVGQHDKIGDATGTLGFVDELVAIVLSPLAGTLSDRIGVSSCAFLIIGCSLFLTVHVRNVYPELILTRMLFGVGGATASCMITAILPAVSARDPRSASRQGSIVGPDPAHREHDDEQGDAPALGTASGPTGATGTTTRVAAVVGLVSGLGALLALFLFLRLPAAFENSGFNALRAVQNTYYITAVLALVLSAICFAGFCRLGGQRNGLEHKGNVNERGPMESKPWSHRPLLRWVVLAFKNGNLGLAFLGSFVARSSSVCIATFVPLMVNHGFLATGKCSVDTRNPVEVKEQCRAAFVISSELTGISQTAGLICALALGSIGWASRRPDVLLGIGAILGVFGFALLGLHSSKLLGPPAVTASLIMIMVTTGASQTLALVSSLGALGQCIVAARKHTDRLQMDGDDERTPLQPQICAADYDKSKGEVAGVYNLAGGLGILCLTKLGGLLFDQVSVAAPFLMLATFNGFLFIICLLSLSTPSDQE